MDTPINMGFYYIPLPYNCSSNSEAALWNMGKSYQSTKKYYHYNKRNCNKTLCTFYAHYSATHTPNHQTWVSCYLQLMLAASLVKMAG